MAIVLDEESLERLITVDDAVSPNLHAQRPRAPVVARAVSLFAAVVAVCSALRLRRTGHLTSRSSKSEPVVLADFEKGKIIRNMLKDRCLDWSDSVIIKTPKCDDNSGRQRWEYSVDNFSHIETNGGDRCMDAGGDFVHYWSCLPEDSKWATNQKWEYDPSLHHIKTHDGACLEVNDDGGAVNRAPCNADEKKQRWTLQGEELPAPAPTSTSVLHSTSSVTSHSSTTTSAASASTSSSLVSATTHKPTMATSTTRTSTTTTTTTPTTTSTTTSTTSMAAVLMHIKHRGQDEYCLDAGDGTKVHMLNCSAEEAQRWEAVMGDDGERTGQLRNGQTTGGQNGTGSCLAKQGDQVKLEACVRKADLSDDSPQMWEFHRHSGQLVLHGDDSLCLDASHGEGGSVVSLKACNASSKNQKWDEALLVTSKRHPAAGILVLLAIPVLMCLGALLFFCSAGKKGKVINNGNSQLPVLLSPRVPDPRLGVLQFADPRSDAHPPRKPLDIIAFNFPGFEEPWDVLCSATFLANGYDLGSGCLQLEANGKTKNFRNAEAAFQALMFWNAADEFANLSGEEALRQKHKRRGQEDWEYAGYEDKWKGMMAVLQAKFKSGSKLEKALEKTGDAFLLNHCGPNGDDPVWSNNNDGEGTNWLGLQLMLLRDRRTGWKKWTKFIESAINMQTGERIHPEDLTPNPWQDAVRCATAAVTEEMGRLGDEDRASGISGASEQPLLLADQVDGTGQGV